MIDFHDWGKYYGYHGSVPPSKCPYDTSFIMDAVWSCYKGMAEGVFLRWNRTNKKKRNHKTYKKVKVYKADLNISDDLVKRLRIKNGNK